MAQKTQWIENNEKAMKLIVDEVRYHIVPILAKQETVYLMFESLESTFEINNINKTLALKRKINHTSINKGECINGYFMRINELRDQLLIVGYKIDS